MLKANKVYLIGIGYRPLGKQAHKIVRKAEVILASSRLLEVFTRYEEYEAVKEHITVINKVPDTIAFLKNELQVQNAEHRTIVLLASGDPLFFGIGRRMVEEFGKERIEIIPDLSSMQEAFSRINVPWDDALLISLHGGPDIAKRRKLPYEIKDIPWLIEKHGKIGVLTDRLNNPVVIAQALQSAIRNPQAEIIMHVCEHLGYPDEKIFQGTPEEISSASFSDPNVVIIQNTGVRSQKPEFTFGLREENIEHERGLITKDEVRAVTIHKLQLPSAGVLWDIGAGSGSVSLEASRFCPGLRIFAIEKEADRIETIHKNILRYRARNVAVVHGSAPDTLAGLPAPDRVFIGGSGGNIGDIITLVQERMSTGIMVINAVTLDTLSDSLASMEKNGFSVEVSEVAISRAKIVGGKRLMNALNPVFIVTGVKG